MTPTPVPPALLPPFEIIGDNCGCPEWKCRECGTVVSRGRYPTNMAHTNDCSYSVQPFIDRAERAEAELQSLRERVEALAPHPKWLRQCAAEIADAGHAGWGNTCSLAADAIDAAIAEGAQS